MEVRGEWCTKLHDLYSLEMCEQLRAVKDVCSHICTCTQQHYPALYTCTCKVSLAHMHAYMSLVMFHVRFHYIDS